MPEHPIQTFDRLIKRQRLLLKLIGIDSYDPAFRIHSLTFMVVCLALTFFFISLYDLYLFRDDLESPIERFDRILSWQCHILRMLGMDGYDHRLELNKLSAAVMLMAGLFMVIYFLRRAGAVPRRPVRQTVRAVHHLFRVHRLGPHTEADAHDPAHLSAYWYQRVRAELSVPAQLHLVERVYSPQAIVEVLSLTFHLVMTLYVMRTNIWLPGLFLIPLCTIQLLVFCIPGTLIELKASKLTESIYDTAWHEMQQQNKQIVHLLLHRSQYPSGVTCAGMVSININLYLNVAKKVYSIFMMMESM
uniref:Odorant receptor n=1 Tax=Anopheles melas TaxID=34690 RepID=A0A182U324_9DIPT